MEWCTAALDDQTAPSAGSGGSGGASAAAGGDDFLPTSSFVDPMLTDLYQISMTYGYWKTGRQDEDSVFDLFFRQNPFHGEFTIFAGLEEVLRYVHSFKFKPADLAILKTKFADWVWVWVVSFIDSLLVLSQSKSVLVA